MMAPLFGRSLMFVVLFGATLTANAQFQTRWRDQRPPTSRPSPFLGLLGTGGNRAVIYQGIVRPQLDLQSQIRTQDRQIDRFMTMTRESEEFGARGSPPSGLSPSQRSFETSAAAARLRGTSPSALRVDVGHPVYFQYREQFFPGFRRQAAP